MPRPRCRADRAATSRRPLPGQRGTSRVLALQTRGESRDEAASFCRLQHQRRVIRRHRLPLNILVGSCLLSAARLLFLIPPGTTYFVLFVCFVLRHLKRSGAERKVYTTTCPKSKVNSFPFILRLLPSTSLCQLPLPEKKRRLYLHCSHFVCRLFGSCGFKL